MAKMAREQAVRERRARKEQKREARLAAAALPQDPPADGSDLAPDEEGSETDDPGDARLPAE